MIHAIARKICSQQCYNNQYLVVSLHSKHKFALKKCGTGEIIVEVSEGTQRGDAIDSNGKPWVSA